MTDQTKYTSKLRDSRILIIGGSSGLGYCVAEACVEHGAYVTISSSNASRVDSAVSRLLTSYPSAKSHVFGLTVDLSNADRLEEELKTLLESTKQKLDGELLDHVIFTAGDALAMIKLEDMNIQNIMQAGTSFKSSYIITAGAVSEKPMPHWSVIASYASALHATVRSLALDLKPIRVNGVSPGAVDTELWRMPQEQKEQAMKSMAEKMATGRPGQPEDVAESYLGLLKDWNIDGSMISTNGGSLIM
ncbi:hypothetical protein ACN47E_004430 [Coniothyrium glycines]